MMRNLNPCPENFSQNVVDWDNLVRWGGGGEVLLIFFSLKTQLHSFFAYFSFLPSSFLSLLSFFPPSLLPFFFSSFLSMKNVSFLSRPLIQVCTSRGGGLVIYYTELEVPKNTFTFLFLPPSFLSFLLSSPPSSFLSLISFFPPSLLPFFFSFFSVTEKCAIFFPAPDLNLYLGGGRG